MTLPSRRWVSWAAVSTLPQAEKISLTEQLSNNRRHIERWGGDVVAELVVPGQSRNIILMEDACRAIEAYALLRDHIRRRDFDILICYDRSRLGRKASLSMAIVELCQDAGIIVYETEAPPPDLTPTKNTIDVALVGAIKSVMAQEEIRKFSERSAMGMVARVKAGLPASGLSYGYKWIYNPDGTKHIIIDEIRAEAVRLIFNLYIGRNYTVKWISEQLTLHGYPVPRGREWRDTGVRAIIRNMWTYAGYAQYRGPKREHVFARGQWEPIITEDLARAIEKERADRDTGPRAVNTPHRFGHLVYCGYCGAKAYGQWWDDARNHYMYYECRYQCKGSKTAEWRVAAALEAVVNQLWSHVRVDQLIAGLPDTGRQRREELAKVRAVNQEIATERQRLTIAYTKDLLKLHEYESLMAPLTARQAASDALVVQLEEQVRAEPDATEYRAKLLNIRDDGLAMLEHPDRGVTNQWLRGIGIRVTLAHDPQTGRTAPNRVVRVDIAP